MATTSCMDLSTLFKVPFIPNKTQSRALSTRYLSDGLSRPDLVALCCWRTLVLALRALCACRVEALSAASVTNVIYVDPNLPQLIPALLATIISSRDKLHPLSAEDAARLQDAACDDRQVVPAEASTAVVSRESYRLEKVERAHVRDVLFTVKFLAIAQRCIFAVQNKRVDELYLPLFRHWQVSAPAAFN